jgi:hypothetical protein
MAEQSFHSLGRYEGRFLDQCFGLAGQIRNAMYDAASRCFRAESKTMKPQRETWWTRGAESPGGIPEAVLVCTVPALRDLAVGECTFADAPLEEMKHDDHFHPAPGTPERSFRHRVLTASAGSGREREVWMRMG